MSDTFENSNIILCPACNKETSKTNTFCAECGERIIPLGADGAFAPPVEAEAAEAPAAPPWHEPSENPYANVNAEAEVVNPYSNSETNVGSSSMGTPYDAQANNNYTTPPSYQRADGQPRPPVTANTMGGGAPGESKVLAIVSLVCGIASLVCCCVSFFVAVAGLITGIIVLTKNKNGRGMAIAGVVLSAVSLLIYTVILIVYVVLIQQNGLDYTDIYREFGLTAL
ncbi:MAG: DUF4190 domain-containing protein [Lachnospiraceae bacterium]|nr:DUF4190 domain-containing protein [Lachnospiraceae bacterium]